MHAFIIERHAIYGGAVRRNSVLSKATGSTGHKTLMTIEWFERPERIWTYQEHLHLKGQSCSQGCAILCQATVATLDRKRGKDALKRQPKIQINSASSLLSCPRSCPAICIQSGGTHTWKRLQFTNSSMLEAGDAASMAAGY